MRTIDLSVKCRTTAQN